jgi:hypothetical protein
VLGLIGTLIAVGTPIWWALAEPTVDVLEIGATSPFFTPITVTNQSFVFAMYEAQVLCGIKQIALSNGVSMHGFTVLTGEKRTIEPGKPSNFQCRITDSAPNQLVKTEITVHVTFKTLGKERASDPVDFSWFTNANPPRWIRGPSPR